jgi:hypothetical protein
MLQRLERGKTGVHDFHANAVARQDDDTKALG